MLIHILLTNAINLNITSLINISKYFFLDNKIINLTIFKLKTHSN